MLISGPAELNGCSICAHISALVVTIAGDVVPGNELVLEVGLIVELLL
jgi:hypothetical protein